MNINGLTSPYEPGPGQKLKGGGVMKVTIEGEHEFELWVDTGTVLIEPVLTAMLALPNVPVPSLHLPDDPKNWPCEFVSFDRDTDHLTVRLKSGA